MAALNAGNVVTASDPLFTLEGRVIAVTGGLGQLGRSFSRCLLARGAKVAILDLPNGDRPLDPQLSSALEAGTLRVIACEVTDRKSIETACAEIESIWEVPHGLINNAALDSPPDAPAAETGPFETYPERSWDKVMEVNAKGVFLCCQVIGGAMARAGRGSIVNIGSTYGIVSPDQRIYEFRRSADEAFFKPVAYSASKSALYNLTRYLATYWAERQVRVNIMTIAGVFNNQPQPFLDAYCPRVPLGRMARQDEYDGAIVFLMSDASSYMTGSTLTIDGGWTAW